MTPKTWEEWKAASPKLVRLLVSELGQDFDIFGDNLKEILANYVSEKGVKPARNILLETESLLPLLRNGKINPDQMLEELETCKLPEYDHLPTLQYFEDICAFLKEDIAQKMKEESKKA